MRNENRRVGDENEDEVQITSEMAQAGAEVLWRVFLEYYPDLNDGAFHVARLVYQAMEKHNPCGGSGRKRSPEEPECEACDETEAPLCEGCSCCEECCNCTSSDCDCDTCTSRRSEKNG